MLLRQGREIRWTFPFEVQQAKLTGKLVTCTRDYIWELTEYQGTGAMRVGELPPESGTPESAHVIAVRENFYELRPLFSTEC